MRLNSTGFFVVVLLGIGIVSVIRGQPLDGLIAAIAAAGIVANDAARRPGATLARLGKYVFLGLLAFLAVIRLSMPS